MNGTRLMEPVTVPLSMARQRHPAVGRTRFYTALRSGTLPSVRVGRRTAIRVDALDAWVALGCPTEKVEAAS